ncbi:MAG TPA: type II toxin-antitoxin system prevent-host-death family antitoxin [Verrucomicrobiae bacterium]|nr:type II toxin-antitoxin system prevent-host-death family antitoxin [Verrucomicrobiae bacterium]
MKDTAISVTEASRNFAHCVNRVHYQNRSFVLVKNGKPLARLIPEIEKKCTGRELAAALSKVELTAGEFAAWNRDLRKARKTLKPPGDKWQ